MLCLDALFLLTISSERAFLKFRSDVLEDSGGGGFERRADWPPITFGS